MIRNLSERRNHIYRDPYPTTEPPMRVLIAVAELAFGLLSQVFGVIHVGFSQAPPARPPAAQD